jgi:hypothetical protein
MPVPTVEEADTFFLMTKAVSELFTLSRMFDVGYPPASSGLSSPDAAS